MPTPTKGPRLGGGPAHERLMLANLATALFEHGKITTTEAKAKAQSEAEKLGDLTPPDQVSAEQRGFILFQPTDSPIPEGNIGHFGCGKCHGVKGEGGGTSFITSTPALRSRENTTVAVPPQTINVPGSPFYVPKVCVLVCFGPTYVTMPPFETPGFSLPIPGIYLVTVPAVGPTSVILPAPVSTDAPPSVTIRSAPFVRAGRSASATSSRSLTFSISSIRSNRSALYRNAPGGIRSPWSSGRRSSACRAPCSSWASVRLRSVISRAIDDAPTESRPDALSITTRVTPRRSIIVSSAMASLRAARSDGVPCWPPSARASWA